MEERECRLFIVITASPSPLANWRGVSAAAWDIGPTGKRISGLEAGRFGVEVTDCSHSDESEAALLALNAALREVKNRKVTVFASQKWICNAINGGVDSWAADWKDRAHKNLWQQYIALRTSHSLQVEAKCVPGADPFAGNRFKFLRKQARSACARRSKELGTPTAGFDLVTKASKEISTRPKRGNLKTPKR